jgi:hypothetical protein
VNIYGRDGKPMSLEAFAAVPRKKRIVKQSTLILAKEPISVLTMWDGVDHSEGESPVPLPFSTFVHSESFPNIMLSVPDEKHARMSHEMALGFVRSQGGKGGWRIPLWFLTRVWDNPRTVKHAWFNMALCLAVVAVQLATLTASAVMWDWDWSDLLPVAFVALYGYWLKNSVVALKRKLRERKEERRAAADKEAFDEIVGRLE